MMKFIPIKANAGITGFESPAQLYSEFALSLDDLLVSKPSSTLLGRATGDSMVNIGIFDGDLLVVDSGADAIQNDIVACNLNGEFSVAQIDINQMSLVPANHGMTPVKIVELDTFTMEGVVISSVRLHRIRKQLTESTRFEVLPQEYRKLDSKIDDMLIRNPSSTWLGSANGESMVNVGIFDGDLLIIDRNEKAAQYDVVVCNLNGEFTVKLLDIQNKSLVSANPRMKPVPISELDIFSLEGVVISSIRQHRSLTQLAGSR